MHLDPVDFFPGYEPYQCPGRRRSIQECHSCFWTNLIAIVLSVVLCSAGFYYYEVVGKDIIEKWNNPSIAATDGDCINIDILIKIKREINKLKQKMDKADKWQKHLNNFCTMKYAKQDENIENKVNKALDVYDSDKIGMFDYAAVYASGSIISTPYTSSYPVNKTISILGVLKINVLSNPDNMLHPNNLPGNCFAFYGTEGRIRIKLGKKIVIKAVTMDNIMLYENRSSSPRDFEVYGLVNSYDTPEILLGTFTYNLKGRPYQTFEVNNTANRSFEFVELRILNNYGKEEFTCLYRFRVHDTFIKKN